MIEDFPTNNYSYSFFTFPEFPFTLLSLTVNKMVSAPIQTILSLHFHRLASFFPSCFLSFHTVLYGLTTLAYFLKVVLLEVRSLNQHMLVYYSIMYDHSSPCTCRLLLWCQWFPFFVGQSFMIQHILLIYVCCPKCF